MEPILFSPPYHTKRIDLPPPIETIKSYAESVIDVCNESDKAKSQLYNYLEEMQNTPTYQFDKDFVPTLSILVDALMVCTNNDLLVAERSRKICNAYECFKELISQQPLTAPLLELHLHYIHSLKCLDKSVEAQELCYSLIENLAQVDLPNKVLVVFENKLRYYL